jgi:hypothetical protein
MLNLSKVLLDCRKADLSPGAICVIFHVCSVPASSRSFASMKHALFSFCFGHQRTIQTAALCENFTPAFRCDFLQDTKYCCETAPRSDAKFFCKSLLRNDAAKPSKQSTMDLQDEEKNK